MRQKAPLLLILIVAGSVLPAMGSVAPSSRSTPIPELSLPLSHQRQAAPRDAHPFFTEFYLQQFATEPVVNGDHERSSWFSPVLNPVSNAASSLSKRVASLRRALVRMMP